MPTVKTDTHKIEIDKALDLLSKWLRKQNFSRLFVLVDENTKRHCLPLFHEAVDLGYELIQIASGETHKSLDTCLRIWNELIYHKADRHSLLINLGGGVIGDMGGFVAASYMRGMPFMHMPTTLLAQVDASIGGKVGVDYRGYKNLLGTYKNPALVWIHSPFIQTLPERELLSGFAELIKHGLIQSKPLWERIKTKGVELSPEEWSKAIHESVKIKNKVVVEDPFESGPRKILNFGHTIGHAIESLFLNTEAQLLHGEAIAKGMIVESYLSFKTKRLSIIEMEEINSLLESIYDLPTLTEAQVQQVTQLMAMDKKNKGGEKMFSLLNGIGKCDYDVVLEDRLVKEALMF